LVPDDGHVDGRRLAIAIAGFGLVASSCGTSARQVPARTGSDVAREAVLAEAFELHHAPGLIAAVIDGGAAWRGAAGVADLDGTPAEPSMRFRAASITKLVVAAITMRLAARGVVDLDAPVAPLLPPGVLRAEPPVTLRHLLGHTAGIFDIGNEGDVAASIAAIPDGALRELGLDQFQRAVGDPSVVVTAEVCVAAAETNDRYGQPGEVFHYSNTGYEIVGLVLAAVTGSTLGDLVEEEIAGPLGLDSMTLAPEDRTLPAFHGTTLRDGVPCGDPTGDVHLVGTGAAIGLLTTAEDLALFASALMAGEVVDADRLRAMTEPGSGIRAASVDYGLGVARYGLSCGQFYGHRGAGFGTGSIVLADADGDRAVVLVANALMTGGAPLTRFADDLLCGDPAS
jgi:D-alanyl-D-alanine carboxypeptidase